MASEKNRNSNYFNRITYRIVSFTETFYYKLGCKIATYPVRTIVICWAVVFLSLFGFLRFHQEKNPVKLWVPPHTTFVKDTEWLTSTFQMGLRKSNVVFRADNVLKPDIMNELMKLRKEVANIRTVNNYTWTDICFKIPKMNKHLIRIMEGDPSKDNGTEKDMSLSLDPALYCSFIEVMKEECYEKSILDLWDYNEDIIANLTEDDIIRAINSYDPKTILGRFKNYEHLLGDIVRNETGHIIGAATIENAWMVRVNFSSVDIDKAGNIGGTGVWANEDGLEWELAFINLMENASHNMKYEFYYAAMRSFADATFKSMFQDMDKIALGVVIMVIYVLFVISRYNWLEARVCLSVCGLMTIGMSFIVGCGLCSLVGVSFGPIHASLPFLLMGLGVDDMFVIAACWDDLSQDNKALPLPERIGMMLRHAGVSISITALTDVIAFIVGSVTILPTLNSFCIYAGVSVFAIFVFVITFFTACFTLDQIRQEQGRNGILPCIKHKDYEPNPCSQQYLTNRVFHFIYDNAILTTTGTFLVLSITVACLGFGIQGCFMLRQKFNPEWLVPVDSYYGRYIPIREKYYPRQLLEGGLYIGAVNYTHEFQNIHRMIVQLESKNDSIFELNSWVEPFRNFVLVNFHEDLFIDTISEDRFNIYLSKFLFSPKYATFQGNFQFEKPLECGVSAPKIILSYADFYFKHFRDRNEYVPAMHDVRSIAENSNLTTGEKYATVWSIVFSTWTTDELIDEEVLRNLQLALICVMACTMSLTADWQTCLWIFICVLLTMVEVCGFMARWGVTIDMVSCIGLELGIGICVDYATHIGHTFLTVEEGDRKKRALKTVSTIGAAVVYGGLSTFIGILMLSQSDQYIFKSFFKIFTLIMIFGLYNGVVFLPVMLSWIGPKPYTSHKPIVQSDNNEMTVVAFS